MHSQRIRIVLIFSFVNHASGFDLYECLSGPVQTTWITKEMLQINYFLPLTWQKESTESLEISVSTTYQFSLRFTRSGSCETQKRQPSTVTCLELPETRIGWTFLFIIYDNHTKLINFEDSQGTQQLQEASLQRFEAIQVTGMNSLVNCGSNYRDFEADLKVEPYLVMPVTFQQEVAPLLFFSYKHFEVQLIGPAGNTIHLCKEKSEDSHILESLEIYENRCMLDKNKDYFYELPLDVIYKRNDTESKRNSVGVIQVRAPRERFYVRTNSFSFVPGRHVVGSATVSDSSAEISGQNNFILLVAVSSVLGFVILILVVTVVAFHRFVHKNKKRKISGSTGQGNNSPVVRESPPLYEEYDNPYTFNITNTTYEPSAVFTNVPFRGLTC